MYILSRPTILMLLLAATAAHGQDVAPEAAPPPPSSPSDRAAALQPPDGAELPRELLAPPAPERDPIPSVVLQENGAVLGVVGTLDPDTGGLRPVPGAIVTFVDRGRVVGQVRTDRDGRFAVPGLRPGLHSVFAVAPEGFAALAIMVDPHVANADGRAELYLTLVPRSDAIALPGILGANAPFGGKGFGGFGGFGGGLGGGIGGGGGGAGGNLAALAGLAGLAGLAPLFDDDEAAGDQAHASPFQP